MAVTPRARRRAINVDAPEGPLVPVHETEARAFVRANKEKNKQAGFERQHKAACHKAMAAANVASFEFTEGNALYDAVIAGGSEEKCSVEKLYAKFTEGTITLRQFLDSLSAPQANVKKHCGANVLAAVLETTPKEADLSIKERKV